MFLNVSFYAFVELTDPDSLRAEFQKTARDLGLKGTVLLAPEGLNLFLSGTPDAIAGFRSFLLERTPLTEGDLARQWKESRSDEVAFRRMLVKRKKEIITLRRPDVNPARDPAPRLPAAELKKWLDEGRDFVLLDTRNDYEVRLGTFERAEILPLQRFTQFPEAVSALLPGEKRGKPVVTFCTGGIRCEKAAPLLRQLGFPEVYQLDGGILRYFEEVGGAHYRGECFVFDRRVAVDPALRETGTVACYACRAPVTPEEQRDPRYAPERSCAACHRPRAQ